jgi:hypothetical protein
MCNNNYEQYSLILTKILYSPNNILLHGVQYGSRTDICVHAVALTDTYTPFSDSNKQIVLSQCNSITLYFIRLVIVTTTCTVDMTTNVFLLQAIYC